MTKTAGVMKTPPVKGSKPEGKLACSPEQDRAYRTFIEKMSENESKGESVAIKVSWARGAHAKSLIEDRGNFGPRTAAEIAQDLGVESGTVSQSIKFSTLLTKERVEELCNMKPRPPSWRMMQKWMTIKDDKEREKKLNDIIAGRIDVRKGRAALENALKDGPKARKPKGTIAAFAQMEARVKTLSDALDTIPISVKSISEIKDTAQQKECQTMASKGLESLKTLREQIDEIIKACENVVG